MMFITSAHFHVAVPQCSSNSLVRHKTRMAYSSYIPGLWLTLLLSLVSTARAKVPAVIVFGDSTVDTGNNNKHPTILKSNFAPYGRDFEGGRPTGRFCNGRLPPDFISEAFGLKKTVPAYLDPEYAIADFATAVSFASAGTGYDDATAMILNTIPLCREMDMYKDYQNKLRAHVGEQKAKEIISESVYLLSLGTNDFLENFYIFPQRRIQFTVEQYQDFLIGLAEDFIRQIYSLGARKLSLTALPPMGCLPLERAINGIGRHDCVTLYNNVALEFNQKMRGLIIKLNKELAGMKILDANVYDILYKMITEPSSFGFEFATRACCATGTLEISYLCNSHNPLTCPDASKFVFWDAFHPTEKANKMMSDYLIPQLKSNFT